MSLISARLYVKVTEPSVWEKLMSVEMDDDLFIGESPEEFFGEPMNNNSTQLLIDSEWSPDPDSFTWFISSIKEAAGEDCVVIGDLTDLNVGPFNYCVAEIDINYTKEIRGEMHYKVSINDVEKWLKKARIQRTVEVLKYLAKFDGENFEFARNELKKQNIPIDDIALTKTSGNQ